MHWYALRRGNRFHHIPGRGLSQSERNTGYRINVVGARAARVGPRTSARLPNAASSPLRSALWQFPRLKRRIDQMAFHVPVLIHRSEFVPRGDCGARKSDGDRQRVNARLTDDGMVGLQALEVRLGADFTCEMRTGSIGHMENFIYRPPRQSGPGDMLVAKSPSRSKLTSEATLIYTCKSIFSRTRAGRLRGRDI